MKEFKKYIIEFFVIVFSIIAAFGLERWSDNLNEFDKQVEMIIGLENELTANISAIERMISLDSSTTAGNAIILDFLNNKNQDYDSSLSYYFGRMNTYSLFFPKRIAFETLKSNGLDLIENDTLLGNIVELFDQTYLESNHDMELKKERYFYGNTIMLKHFTTVGRNLKWPNNVMAIIEDTEFKNWLTHIHDSQLNLINLARDQLMKTKQLRNQVRKEITRLKYH